MSFWGHLKTELPAALDFQRRLGFAWRLISQGLGWVGLCCLKEPELMYAEA